MQRTMNQTATANISTKPIASSISTAEISA